MTAIDERKLRKHWTRIARVKDMNNGILRRNILTQCRVVSASADAVEDWSGAVMTEADGFCR